MSVIRLNLNSFETELPPTLPERFIDAWWATRHAVGGLICRALGRHNMHGNEWLKACSRCGYIEFDKNQALTFMVEGFIKSLTEALTEAVRQLGKTALTFRNRGDQ